MLLKDIRDDQILFLGLFLVLGIGTGDWTLRPELIGVAIATSLATLWILSWVTIAAAIAIATKFAWQRGDEGDEEELLTPVQTRLIASLLTPVQTRLIASLLTPNPNSALKSRGIK